MDASEAAYDLESPENVNLGISSLIKRSLEDEALSDEKLAEKVCLEESCGNAMDGSTDDREEELAAAARAAYEALNPIYVQGAGGDESTPPAGAEKQKEDGQATSTGPSVKLEVAKLESSSSERGVNGQHGRKASILNGNGNGNGNGRHKKKKSISFAADDFVKLFQQEEWKEGRKSPRLEGKPDVSFVQHLKQSSSSLSTVKASPLSTVKEPRGLPASQSPSAASSVSILSPDSALQLHLDATYNEAVIEKNIAKNAKRLSIIQGCVLATLLLILYILFCGFFYSKWNTGDTISFLDGILLAMYTITTVGYGNETPSTQVGILVTIIVMLLGIALLTICVAQIFQLMKLEKERKESNIDEKKTNMLKGLKRRLGISSTESGSGDDDEDILHQRVSEAFKEHEVKESSCLSSKCCSKVRRAFDRFFSWFVQSEAGIAVAWGLLIVAIILILGLWVGHYEQWTFLESMYFAIATLTTVGYGDFAPTTTGTKVSAHPVTLLPPPVMMPEV